MAKLRLSSVECSTASASHRHPSFTLARTASPARARQPPSAKRSCRATASRSDASIHDDGAILASTRAVHRQRFLSARRQREWRNCFLLDWIKRADLAAAMGPAARTRGLRRQFRHRKRRQPCSSISLRNSASRSSGRQRSRERQPDLSDSGPDSAVTRNISLHLGTSVVPRKQCAVAGQSLSL